MGNSDLTNWSPGDIHATHLSRTKRAGLGPPPKSHESKESPPDVHPRQRLQELLQAVLADNTAQVTQLASSPHFDASITDDDGLTIYDIASRHGGPAVIEALVAVRPNIPLIKAAVIGLVSNLRSDVSANDDVGLTLGRLQAFASNIPRLDGRDQPHDVFDTPDHRKLHGRETLLVMNWDVWSLVANRPVHCNGGASTEGAKSDHQVSVKDDVDYLAANITITGEKGNYVAVTSREYLRSSYGHIEEKVFQSLRQALKHPNRFTGRTAPYIVAPYQACSQMAMQIS